MPDEEKINDFGIYSTQSDSGDTREAYRVRPGETRQFYVDATFKVSEYGSYYIKLNSLRWDTDGDENSARNIITGSQLSDLKSGSQSLGISTVVSSVCPYTFTKNLSLGDWDFEVKKVQQFLNEKGFRVALSGAGSPGYENLYFGPATQAAVIRFQNEYFNEIIRVAGLTAANGVWGPASRAQANRMCTGSVSGANITISGLGSDSEWVLGDSHTVRWNRAIFVENDTSYRVDIGLCGEGWGDCVTLVEDSNNDGVHYVEMSGFNAPSDFDGYIVMRRHTENDWSVGGRGSFRSEKFTVIVDVEEQEDVQEEPEEIYDTLTADVQILGLANNIIWRSGEQHCVTWNPGAYDQTVDIILWRYSDGPSRWISDSLLSNDYDATTGRACYTLRKGEVPPAYGNIYKIGVGRGEDKSSTAFYFWDALPEDTSTQETEPTEPTTPTEPTGYSEPEILGLETQGSLENIWTIGLSKPVKWDDDAVNRDTVDIMLCSNSECFMYLARNIANDGLHYVTVLDSYARSYYRIGIVGYGTASIGVNLDSRNTSEHFILRD